MVGGVSVRLGARRPVFGGGAQDCAMVDKDMSDKLMLMVILIVQAAMAALEFSLWQGDKHAGVFMFVFLVFLASLLVNRA
jgi:hypothetical protein